MKPILCIANLPNIFLACLGYEFVLRHFHCKKCSRLLSTATTYMQLSLKDDFPCKFVYLCIYLILCFVQFKKPLNELVKFFTQPVYTCSKSKMETIEDQCVKSVESSEEYLGPNRTF